MRGNESKDERLQAGYQLPYPAADSEIRRLGNDLEACLSLMWPIMTYSTNGTDHLLGPARFVLAFTVMPVCSIHFLFG